MFTKAVTVKYKALLWAVPPGRRFLLLKVIMPLPTVIEAIISSGVTSGERSILFSFQLRAAYAFMKPL